MDMISAAVSSKTKEQTDKLVAALTALLEAVVSGNQDMVQAIQEGQTIMFDNREVARMVREYA